MINQPYASVDFLHYSGIGSCADEICKNLVGTITEIEIPNDNNDPPYSDVHQVRILAAHVDMEYGVQFPDGYVRVDAEKV